MTVVVGGSSPQITFADSTVQNTAALPLTGGSVSADITVHGLTVGLGGGPVATNTAVGTSASGSNTTGANTTAVGYQANNSGNQTGSVAIGSQALYTGGGSQDVAVGYQAGYSATSSSGDAVYVGWKAGYSNTTGGFNVAVGQQSLYSNTTASNNVAVGYQAGYSNTTGAPNVFVGRQVGYTNSTGTQNTAIGDQAFYYNTTGGSNSAIGFNALLNNTTGSGNTSAGQISLTNCTTGSWNTGIGYAGLRDLTTGSGNIAVGTLNSSSSYQPVFNVTTQNDRIVMGSTAVTNAYVNVAWTVVSDARDKTDVVPISYGLSFVTKLKPIIYKWDRRSQYENGVPDGSKKDTKIQAGFLAQDVIALEKENGATDGNLLIADDEVEDHLKVTETKFIPVLVKAIQELNALVTAQATEIAALKAKVGA